MTTHRLATILAADVVGFSSSIGEGRGGHARGSTQGIVNPIGSSIFDF
jgi:hypothetical protein